MPYKHRTKAELKAEALALAKKRRFHIYKPRSPQFRELMRQHMQGRVRPASDRVAISQGLRGRSLSFAHRIAIAEALRGRPRPMDVRDRIASTLRGQQKPEHVKSKISMAMKEYWREVREGIIERKMPKRKKRNKGRKKH